MQQLFLIFSCLTDYGNKKKQSNNLPINGNEASMNLNPLILTNIQSSSYFKVTLFKLKTYHEVIDEIYYQVKHLEPWERGSRKTSGQTGMCGGVGNVSNVSLECVMTNIYIKSNENVRSINSSLTQKCLNIQFQRIRLEALVLAELYQLLFVCCTNCIRYV